MRNTYLQMCDYTSRFRILKGGKISLVVSALIASVTLLHANPSGGVVTAGSVSIAHNGSTTNITQSSQKAAINWQKFSIGSSETVNFKQPNVSSITLNRVIGNEKSVIKGALNANGQVFILNSNGVLFSKNASINTAGLVATTMNLSDTDFMKGNYHFSGESQASIINQGTINISDKGYAALFGKEVSNEGIIKATLGKVEMVGAKKVTLNLNGNSLVNLTVDKGVLDALVENKGAIYANGGEVYLTTNAVNELLKGVVNNTGVIEANSLDDITGKVELYAHGGTTTVNGTLSATDGFIETSGKTLHVSDETSIKAKEWLLDPTDITVESSGSTSDLTSSSVKASFIELTLNDGTSVTLTADHDITVDETITWSTDQALTLSAGNDIFINQAITAQHADGKLALYYGQANGYAGNTSNYHINAKINLNAGDNFSTKLGNDGTVTTWIVVTDADAMQAMTLKDTAARYVLGTDLSLSGTHNWTPIGNGSSRFKGQFDGLGHTVSNLNINDNTKNYVGLFGYIQSATIKNIGVVDASITGGGYVGGLVGFNYGGAISDSYATGSVNSEGDYVGGLVGFNYGGDISNAYATGSVSGNNIVGGLVGYNYNGDISNAYATGSVSGNEYVGGLVGVNYGAISNSFYNAEATTINGVSGVITAGGIYDAQFTNWLQNGKILNIDDYLTLSSGSYTLSNMQDLKDMLAFVYTGNYDFKLISDITLSEGWYIPELAGTFDGGGHILKGLNIQQLYNNFMGFVGKLKSSGSIQNLGLTDVAVSGNDNVGGLVGYNYGTISNSYATGSVSGNGYVGGLVGVNDGGTISDSYATGSVSGNDYIGGLVGYTDYGTITNTYATGSVSGNGFVGGLVGYNFYGDISDSYATGSVSGNDYIGGLVGYNDGGTISKSFWNTETSGQTVGVGEEYGTTNLTGVTTKQMQTLSTFMNAGWDIQEDASLFVGTPVLSMTGTPPTWLLGTKVASSGGETSTPTSPQTITQVTSQIVQSVQQQPFVNLTPPTQPTPPIAKFSNNGQTYEVFMQPVAGVAMQEMSFQQLSGLMGSSRNGVSMPLLQGLLLNFTQGGINLPDGVNQLFYIAQREGKSI